MEDAESGLERNCALTLGEYKERVYMQRCHRNATKEQRENTYIDCRLMGGRVVFLRETYMYIVHVCIALPALSGILLYEAT